VRASRSAVVQRVRRLRERISHLRRLLRKRKKRLAKEEDSERRRRLRFLLHQKKRHLRALEQRLDFLQEETVRSVRARYPGAKGRERCSPGAVAVKETTTVLGTVAEQLLRRKPQGDLRLRFLDSP